LAAARYANDPQRRLRGVLPPDVLENQLMYGATAGVSRPLIVTADDMVLDELLRLAVAAGVAVDVAHDEAAARRLWNGASLVLVGADMVDRLIETPPPRRRRVIMVGTGAHPNDARTWQCAVAVGAEHVVSLSADEAWLVAELGDAQDAAQHPGAVVAVVSGCGGAGASVLSVALALAGVRAGHETLLLDGDRYGGGLDLVLGAEHQTGARWPDLARTRGRVSGPSLRGVLPIVDGLAVLSWDRGEPQVIDAAAIRAVLNAAERTADLIIVDVPRDLGAIGAELLPRALLTLLLVPAEVRAVAAATRVAHEVRRHTGTARIVVRGRGVSALDAATVATAVGLPLMGELANDSRLRRVLDHGEAARRMSGGPLGDLCERIVNEATTSRVAA
jgi:secretion/DNA translocation related CpaE-like protein